MSSSLSRVSALEGSHTAVPVSSRGDPTASDTEDPLDADTLDVHIPQLCQLDTRIGWDQGECDACPFQ